MGNSNSSGSPVVNANDEIIGRHGIIIEWIKNGNSDWCSDHHTINNTVPEQHSSCIVLSKCHIHALTYSLHQCINTLSIKYQKNYHMFSTEIQMKFNILQAWKLWRHKRSAGLPLSHFAIRSCLFVSRNYFIKSLCYPLVLSNCFISLFRDHLQHIVIFSLIFIRSECCSTGCCQLSSFSTMIERPIVSVLHRYISS